MNVEEGRCLNLAMYLFSFVSLCETLLDRCDFAFQLGTRRWVGGGVLWGRSRCVGIFGGNRCVGVFGVSCGIIKGLMDSCELCIEAREELVDFMCVIVRTCDIGIEGGVNVRKADEDGFD